MNSSKTALKITEHLGRIGQRRLNIDGAYIRKSDLIAIFVEGLIVKIHGTNLRLNYYEEEDVVMLGDFVLMDIQNDGALAWRHSVTGEELIWIRCERERLENALSILSALATGKDCVNKVKPSRVQETSESPVGTQEIENAFGTTSMTIAEMNEIHIPPLRELDLLSIHLEQVEHLAHDLDIVREENGRRTIVPLLRVPFLMRVLTSVSELHDVERTIRQSMRLCSYNYFDIQQTLMDTYCTRYALREAYKRRLMNLKFTDATKVEQFILNASMAHSIARRLYKDSHMGPIVREIIERISPDIRGRLIGKLMRKADESEDWEEALPFDHVQMNNHTFRLGPTETVLSTLRTICAEVVENISLGGNHSQARNESKNSTAVMRVFHSPIDQFATENNSTFVVSGPPCRDVPGTIAKLNAAGFTKIQDRLPREGSRHYFVVGSDKPRDTADAMLSTLRREGYAVSDYVARPKDGCAFNTAPERLESDSNKTTQKQQKKEEVNTEDQKEAQNKETKQSQDHNKNTNNLEVETIETQRQINYDTGTPVGTDKLSNIHPISRYEPPPELVLHGTLQHPNVGDVQKVDLIVDPGAGWSYILLPPNYSIQLPLERCNNALSVQFADSSTQLIKSQFKGSLSIHGFNGEPSFTEAGITLYTLVTAPKQEHESIKVLLGRDLIRKFHIDIIEGTDVKIGTVSLIRGNQDDGDLALHVRDGINHLRTFIHPNLLGRIPSELLRDIGVISTEHEEMDQHEENETAADNIELPQIRIGTPDAGAPWGRLEISVPWRSRDRPPRNFKSAWYRDKVTCDRLGQQELEQYDEALKTLIDGRFGAIETTEGYHYIATRPVYKRERLSTKCRLCLDARLINLYTHTGKPVGDTTLNCLLTFRTAPFVSIFDLSKAFWQIRLSPEDLGYYNTVIHSHRVEFRSMIFGANYSPAGLERGIQLILSKAKDWLTNNPAQNDDEPERPTTIRSCHYVDDFSCRDDDPRSLLVQSNWTRWWLAKFGFTSDKFLSNVERNSHGEQSYLGYNWNAHSDTLTVKVPEFTVPIGNSLREVVGTIGRYYDPLGLDLKGQLRGRMIVRLAFATRLGNSGQLWGQSVAAEIAPLLKEWIASIATPISSPRQVNSTVLHVFTDASMYCWTVEVRDIDFRLIYARGGLVKTKSSIPKIELHALYMGVHEVMNNLKRFEDLQKITFFCDNECTVYRLRRLHEKLGSYETRRIKAIKELIQSSSVAAEVVHLAGDLNFADYASRPLLERPRNTPDTELIQAIARHPSTTRFNKEIGLQSKSRIDKELEKLLLDEDRVGRMILRSDRKVMTTEGQVTANVSNNTRSPPHHPGDEAVDQEDEEQELGEGGVHRRHIEKIKESQAQGGISEVQFNPRQNPTVDKWGLVRINDKIVIPAQDDTLKRLIIKRAHEGHPGISATRAGVGKNYWWKTMNKDVRRYVSDCEICQVTRSHKAIRSLAGEAFKLKDPEEIPVAAIVGIDVCHVDAFEENKYSCFLAVTCIMTKWIRAIGLVNQTADHVAAQLGRLLHNTIIPTIIVSDNAQVFKSHTFRRFCIRHNIRQVFQPPYSSAYNGWFERSNESILSALRVLVAQSPSKHWAESIETACYMVNRRPYDLTDPTGLCPLHLVFAGARFQEEVLDPDEVEALAARAGVCHLLEPHSAEYVSYAQKVRAKYLRTLRNFEHIYASKRNEVRSRLAKKLKDSSDKFEIGTWVRVWRPTANKVGVRWSPPRLVVAKPSSSTRVVQREDGSTSIEWIANLARASAGGECSEPEN